MEAEDVVACEALWKDSFEALREAYALPGAPPTEADRARLRRRMEYLRDTDPGGAWVADDDGMVVGLAQAAVREDLWVLSLLGVAVSSQSSGVGKALLERALTYGDRGSAGLIQSSRDPRAMRRYVAAGFALLPALTAVGVVDQARLAEVQGTGPAVRHGGREDLAHVAGLGRRLRGAAHGTDVEFLLGEGCELLVADDGFALAGSARPVLLAATDDVTARALLLATLATGTDGAPVHVDWITASQQWAIRSCVEVGLELHPEGAVMVRGAPGPMTPYLPSGAFG